MIKGLRSAMLATFAFYGAGLSFSGSAFASDETDAIAAAKDCANTMMQSGETAIVKCMDEEALNQIKQLMLAGFKKYSINDSGISRRLGDGTTYEVAAAMAPSEFVRRAMEFRIGRKTTDGFKLARINVLGAVKENDVVHVLVRFDFAKGSASISTTELQSYRKRGETWKVLLTEGMAAVDARLHELLK